MHECVCVCVFVSGVDTGLSSFCSFVCCLLSSLSLQHACVHECVCVFVSGVDTGLSSFCSITCCLPVIFVISTCMCA